MRDSLIGRADAEKLLAPHLGAIQAAVANGWADWLAMQAASPRPVPFRKVSRANLVYDFVTDTLENYFVGQGILATRKRHYLEIVFVEARLVLRFKKFRNGKLRTSGIATAHRKLVDYQQAAFDGMEVTYAVIGYLPDREGVEVKTAAVVCWLGGERLWDIPLPDAASAVPVPAHAAEPEAPAVRSTQPTVQEATDEE